MERYRSSENPSEVIHNNHRLTPISLVVCASKPSSQSRYSDAKIVLGCKMELVKESIQHTAGSAIPCDQAKAKLIGFPHSEWGLFRLN
ncbi:MAG: hypothetical protein DDT31_01093 [Syntrophomonadaceae bacterium]|nr:hypothetical protein [Bacillota bacterium]